MTTAITVPALPESVADATLINWTKKPGDPVRAGENLVDLETDKVVLELPAPVSGILKQILGCSQSRRPCRRQNPEPRCAQKGR